MDWDDCAGVCAAGAAACSAAAAAAAAAPPAEAAWASFRVSCAAITLNEFWMSSRSCVVTKDLIALSISLPSSCVSPRQVVKTQRIEREDKRHER